MSHENGNLSINSENMLPIIKKWLYSDKDIFIRELISNANDAIKKFKKLVNLGEAAVDENEKYQIKVVVDSENKTIQVIDNGIGMTADEVKQYINQIAFSGVTDFVNKYQGKLNPEDQIIGHFGLGFYSAFMVADKVQIDTLSYIEGASPVKWICTGGIEYEMDESDRQARGTTITLYVGEDGKEFLNEFTLKDTLQKYCSFMPVEIYFEKVEVKEEKEENTENNEEAKKENAENNEENEETEKEEPKPINNPNPLWLKDPKECKEDEYKEFYHELFHDFKEPLFWIHLNMDYPFRLKGILYFPKLSHELETAEGEIKLYNNQVYVADNIKEVIPEFMLLLKGVIDCPDLPLNVSRSFLQNDGYAKKVSDYITRKIGDKLVSLFKTERENFEKFWDDICIFIKYGCMREEKLYDKVKDILLFKTTDTQYMTLSEYLDKNKATNENTVFYVSDPKQQAQYIKIFKEQNMDAVIMDTKLDTPYMSFLESKNEKVKFSRIDADLSDNLKDKTTETEEDKTTEAELENTFKSALNSDKIKVKLESLKDSSVSAIMLLSEQSRRMQEMYKMFGNMGIGAKPEEEQTLVLNKNNNLVRLLTNLKGVPNKQDDVKLICEQIYDLALIGNRPLETDEMVKFIDRSNKILEKIASSSSIIV